MPRALRPLPPRPTLPLRPGVVLDLGHQELRGPSNTVRLTTLEARLLACLAGAAGETVSRDRLLKEVWGFRRAVATHAVENAVMRARQKIEPEPSRPRHLLTVQAEGYRLVWGITTDPGPTREASLPEQGAEQGRAGLVERVRAFTVVTPLVTLVGPPGVGKGWVAQAAVRPEGAAARLVEDPDEAGVAELRAWLAAGGRALVTSAARLGLPGEQVVTVPPLDADEALAWLEGAVLQARHAPATAEERRDLAALAAACAHLPLGLALAASQLPFLSPAAVLERLRANPIALRRRDGPERQRSWHAALAGPWARLSPSTQAFVRLAALFATAPPLDALGAAVDALPGAAPCDPFEAAAELAESSLASVRVDAARRPALHLYPPLVAFARGVVPPEPEALTWHAEWALLPPAGLPARTGPASGADAIRELEAAWRRLAPRADDLALRLALELADRLRLGDNPALRGEVLAVATAGGPPGRVAAAWLLLAEHHRTADRLPLAQAALDSALPLAGDDPGLRRAHAFQAGALLYRRARRDEAREALEAVHADAGQARDALHTARSAWILGTLAAEGGDISLGSVWYERAREAFQTAGRPAEEARVLNDLGVTQRILGRFDHALVSLQRAEAIANRAGDVRFEAVVRTNLGSLAAARGHWADARREYAVASEVHRRAGSQVGQGTTLNNLADLELEWGDLDAAARAAVAAVAAFEEGDAPLQRGVALATLGDVRACQGLLADALANLLLASQLHDEAKVAPRSARTRLELGVVEHVAGRLTDAAATLDRACAELDLHGDPARRLRARVHRLGVAVARGEPLPADPLPPLDGPAADAWRALARAWTGEASVADAAAAVALCQARPEDGVAPVAGAWCLRLALTALSAAPPPSPAG